MTFRVCCAHDTKMGRIRLLFPFLSRPPVFLLGIRHDVQVRQWQSWVRTIDALRAPLQDIGHFLYVRERVDRGLYQ